MYLSFAGLMPARAIRLQKVCLSWCGVIWGSSEEVDSARYSFNLKTVASLVKLFEKQVPTKGWDMEQVRYLLRKYVLLPNWQDYRKRSRAA